LPSPAHDNDSISPEAWRVVIVATLGPFLSTLDATVVNVPLSGLAAELRTSLSVIQWVASGYLLSLALTRKASPFILNTILNTATSSQDPCGADTSVAFHKQFER
jgi:hypothetical protein